MLVCGRVSGVRRVPSDQMNIAWVTLPTGDASTRALQMDASGSDASFSLQESLLVCEGCGW